MKIAKHENWKRMKAALSHPFPFDRLRVTRGTEATEKSNASLKIPVGLVKR